MLPNVLQPNTTDHVPVLADEVRALLALEPGHTLVDATFGAGGHATLLARRPARAGQGDRDRPRPERPAVLRALPAHGRRPDAVPARRLLDRARRSSPTTGSGPTPILLDLGVSSMQLDRPERGFSYATDAPLDMRMDPSAEYSARDLVNEAARARARADLPALRRGALRAPDRARDRPAPAARSRSSAPATWSRRSRPRFPRRPGSGTVIRPSACSRRCESRSTTSSTRSRTALPCGGRDAPARRTPRGDQLPLARGPDRQALVPRRRRAAAPARPTSRSAPAAASRCCACSRPGRSGRRHARRR